MRRIGMKMLFEVLRYEIGIATNGDPFKLSNSFTAPYARLMIHTYPHLSSLFVIKGKMWVPLLWEDFPEDMLP